MANAEDKIIDHDIEFYTAEVEYCETRRRSALPKNEAYWTFRLEKARLVLKALIDYSQAL